MLSKESLTHFIKAVWTFIRNLAHEFMDKGCQKSAAALTYMTLFALVPLMTVTYSMFSLFSVFDGVAMQLQNLIFSHFVPQTGGEVQKYLSNFSSQARSLTGFGVGILVITAYLMLTNIEKTFNTIWGVKKARRGLSSFLLYWAVLSIGPLLLGAGLVMSTYLLSLKLVVSEFDQLGVSTLLFRLLPIAMTSAAFTLLFAAVPNCRVPIRDAAIGGVLTALCFEALKMVFAVIVAKSSIKLVYGAFAAVPLFLMWINLLWTIILSGAVFVRTLAEKGYKNRASRLTTLAAVLRCLAIFRERSLTGMHVSDRDCVATGVSLVQWQHLRDLLTSNNWIAVTDNGNYVLCRDLARANLWDLAKMVNMNVNEPIPDKIEGEPHWWADYAQRLRDSLQQSRAAFDVSLEEFYAKPSTAGEASYTK